MTTHYQKSVLSNGIRVITEYIPYVRSVSLGIWINSGSKDETPSKNGVSHFLEHMFFKGTVKRDAFQIAQSLESLGGQLNAFTGRDLTCYYARVLDEYLPVALDVLSDILCNSVFNEEKIEKEKHIITEEIRQVQDTPDDLVGELFATSIWTPHPMGFSILGTEETISSLCRADLIDHLSKFYRSENIVIAAAGNIDHLKMVESVDCYFHFPRGLETNTPPLPPLSSVIKQAQREISQVHLCLGRRIFSYNNPKKYALLILNTLLGGGMSSRLFQNIREKLGLAYAVHTQLEFLQDTGLFAVYLATDPAKVEQSLEMVLREFTRLRTTPLSDEELFYAKTQLKGNLVLALESTTARMTRIAKQEIYSGRFQTIDETIAAIDGVSQEEILELANRLFYPSELCLAIVGPERLDEGAIRGFLARSSDNNKIPGQ